MITPQQVAQTMITDMTLNGAALNSRLEQAWDESYWRSLAPTLNLMTSHTLQSKFANESVGTEQDAIGVQLDRDGYFLLRDVVPQEQCTKLCAAIDMLRSEGWPAVFAFVYDDFWNLAQYPSLDQQLRNLFGDDYQMTSDFWVNRVSCSQGAAGWPPHQDHDDRHDRRLVVWISLTDAKPDNGCIYLIPYDHQGAASVKWHSKSSYLSQEVAELLYQVKAVPTRTGSALGWGGDLIHWGGKRTGDGASRVSVSLEFLHQDVVPDDEDRPVYSGAEHYPTFQQRMWAISRAILAYKKFELSLGRYEKFAHAVLDLETGVTTTNIPNHEL